MKLETIKIVMALYVGAVAMPCSIFSNAQTTTITSQQAAYAPVCFLRVAEAADYLCKTGNHHIMVDTLTHDMHPFLKAYCLGPKAFAQAVAASEDIVKEVASLKDKQGRTIIAAMFYNCRWDDLCLLLNSKVALDPAFLFPAIQYGNVKLVQTIINQQLKGTINSLGLSDRGLTPLSHAVWMGRKNIAEYLISEGADVNAKNDDGTTPLMYTLGYDSFKEFAQMLIDAGANINAQQDTHGNTVLMSMTSADEVAWLIEKGANVHARDNHGGTLLMKAVDKNYKDVVDYLIKKRIDINAQDNYGQTALMKASMFGNVEATERLLEAGADTTIKDRGGYTALSILTKSGYSLSPSHKKIVSMLEAAEKQQAH